jgi:hypothetical protein
MCISPLRALLFLKAMGRCFKPQGGYALSELAGIRGLLGLSFLKDFRTILDYRQGYMEIS